MMGLRPLLVSNLALVISLNKSAGGKNHSFGDSHCLIVMRHRCYLSLISPSLKLTRSLCVQAWANAFTGKLQMDFNNFQTFPLLASQWKEIIVEATKVEKAITKGMKADTRNCMDRVHIKLGEGDR